MPCVGALEKGGERRAHRRCLSNLTRAATGCLLTAAGHAELEAEALTDLLRKRTGPGQQC